MMEDSNAMETGVPGTDWKYYAPTILTRQMILRQGEPQDLTVYGPLTIAPDITVEELEAKLLELTVYGPLDYPEYMEQTLRPRIKQVIGPIRSYACELSNLVVMGQLVINQAYLQGLEDGSQIAVLGALRIPEPLPNEILQQKIKGLYVSNGIFCREENRSQVASLLTTQRKMTVTPTDYELVERSILLDRPTLENLPGKKLHCIERVQISPDVDPRTLDNSIEALNCTDYVFCPTELLEVLYRKCKWHETRVLDYSGELWIIDDIRDLPVFGLQALDGVATLVVFGELTIDPAITPQMLTENLFKVHNLSMIVCSPEQKSALTAKQGMKIGEFLDPMEVDNTFH
jgi:hypothetical protein